MPDLAASSAHLHEARSAKVTAIHGNYWRALGASITLQRTNTENVFKGQRNTFRKLFRADQDILQAAEALWRATLQIGLQKGWCRDQECNFVFADKLADNFRIQRVGMIDNTNAVHRGHPQSCHKSKRVEERQDAENLVSAAEHENLRYLLNIRRDIEVRQHHALWIAGAAARKDHGCQIVDGTLGGNVFCADRLVQYPLRCEPGECERE